MPSPTIELSGMDLVCSNIEASVIVVSETLFTKETLECAAARLLVSWPSLAFRMSTKVGEQNPNRTHHLTHMDQRDCVYDCPTTSAYDGFLDLRALQSTTLPHLTGSRLSDDVIEYDGTILERLFGRKLGTWTDVFNPRVLVIKAVLLRDATVFKFILQHAAGDAIGEMLSHSRKQLSHTNGVPPGLYNAVSAFCEGIHGPVKPRASRPDRSYKPLEFPNSPGKHRDYMSTRLTEETLRTPQARAWWPSCTGSLLFVPVTLMRTWWSFWRTPTSWRLVHFSEDILERWRGIARDANESVSTFALFAAWIQMVSVLQKREDSLEEEKSPKCKLTSDARTMRTTSTVSTWARRRRSQSP
jgi:hypothetical protein